MNIVVFLTHNLSLFDWKQIGVLNRELSLYKKLTEKNCNFKIITYGDSKDKKIKNYKNIEIFPIFQKLKKKNKNFFFKFFYPIYFIYRNRLIFKDCNLIKTNQIIGAHLAVIAKILYRKKLIIRLGYEPYILVKAYSKNFILKYLYKLNSIFCLFFADYIIVTTNQIKEKILKYYNVSKKKIGVNPNFVDTDKFTNNNNNNKNYYNAIFTISRLDEQKNLEFLFNQVKESSLQLHIYGSLNGIQKYKVLINKIGCDVRFKGPIDNEKLPMIINNYLIFILLSHSEGNPKALLEAMSCGRVVIGKNVEGINNIIKDQSNGFILDDNKNNLKNIIFKIKNKNKNKLLDIQRNARKHILQNFCIKKIVLRELKIYKYLIKNN